MGSLNNIVKSNKGYEIGHISHRKDGDYKKVGKGEWEKVGEEKTESKGEEKEEKDTEITKEKDDNNTNSIKRLSYDDLKSQGFDTKNPDYRIYDLGTEYNLDNETIKKIKSGKVGYGDTVKVKREVAISEWSLGGESGKKIQKGKTVKTMKIDTEIPVSKLNTMNLTLKQDLLKGKPVKIQNEEPTLNQTSMGFKTKDGIVYTYK